MKIYSLLAIGLILTGCTFAPPGPPDPGAPLPDGNHIDAGIYWNTADKTLHFRDFYITRYQWLVKTYGAKAIPPVTDPTRGVTKLPDGEYHCTIEVTTNFERLDRMTRPHIAP